MKAPTVALLGSSLSLISALLIPPATERNGELTSIVQHLGHLNQESAYSRMKFQDKFFSDRFRRIVARDRSWGNNLFDRAAQTATIRDAPTKSPDPYPAWHVLVMNDAVGSSYEQNLKESLNYKVCLKECEGLKCETTCSLVFGEPKLCRYILMDHWENWALLPHGGITIKSQSTRNSNENDKRHVEVRAYKGEKEVRLCPGIKTRFRTRSHQLLEKRGAAARKGADVGRAG